MVGRPQEGKVLANMRIVFLRDWRAYRKGQSVDPLAAGLGAGPVTELVNRGVAAYEVVGTESAAGYQAMTMKPVQVMTKRRAGRPPGSKNRPKVL